MEIKPVEIQNLLLNLVDALEPLAQGGSPKPKDARFLAKRIFDSSQKSSLNKEDRLLTTLQTAQKQMVKWIRPEKKTGEGNLKVKELKEAPSPMKESSPKIPHRKPSSDLSSPPSLAAQAKDLLAQVRGVINSLSTSSRLGKLEEGVLDDQIGELKRSVEKLIETVERKETDFSGDRGAPSPSRPLPRSPREHLLKSVPLPSFPSKTEEKKPLPKASRSTEKSTPFQKDSFSSSKEPVKAKEEVPFLQGKSLIEPKEDQSRPLPSAERTSLPGAPYLPEKNLFSKLLKKKKKKRSDDEEEEKSR